MHDILFSISEHPENDKKYHQYKLDLFLVFPLVSARNRFVTFWFGIVTFAFRYVHIWHSLSHLLLQFHIWIFKRSHLADKTYSTAVQCTCTLQTILVKSTI